MRKLRIMLSVLISTAILMGNNYALAISPKKFKALDTNKDGKLSYDEYMAPHKKSFKKMDANNDGIITMEELQKYREKKRKKKKRKKKKRTQ